MITTIASNPTSVTRRTDVRPAVSIRTDAEIDAISRAGDVVADVLAQARDMVRPGTTTAMVAARASAIIRDAGGEALPLECVNEAGQRFPDPICTSVDDVVLHGMSDDRPLVAGQVMTVDCSVRLDGWCADAAITVPVGETDPEVGRMVETCDALLETAIDLVRPGLRWSRIARIMQELALDAGFGVVEAFGGHGIGRDLHELPEVPSILTPRLDGGGDFTLRPGMVLAIEPTLVLPGEISGPARGRDDRASGVPILLDADGWSVRTLDAAPAAHVEHTVAVTASGARVLTNFSRPESPRNATSGMSSAL